MLEAARGTQLLTVGDYSVSLDTSGHVIDKYVYGSPKRGAEKRVKTGISRHLRWTDTTPLSLGI